MVWIIQAFGYASVYLLYFIYSPPIVFLTGDAFFKAAINTIKDVPEFMGTTTTGYDHMCSQRVVFNVMSHSKTTFVVCVFMFLRYQEQQQ